MDDGQAKHTIITIMFMTTAIQVNWLSGKQKSLGL